MRRERKLALIMVFVFVLSWLNVPSVQACETPAYSVTYDGNGFTAGIVPEDLNKYYEGDTVTVAGQGSLEKEFHTFAGWNDEPDGSGDFYSGTFCMPGKNLTLYAQWCENQQYSVTYHGNANTEGSSPIDGLSPYYEGEEFIILEPGDLGKDNHTFSVWNTQSDGLGINYSPGQVFSMPGHNLDLYAQWVENDKYTVLYYGNDNTEGTAPVDGDSPYYENSEVTILGQSNLARDHHEFSGWNTAADGSGESYSEGETLIIICNVELYAQWTEDQSYEVIYNGNTNNSGTAPIDMDSPYYEGIEVTVLGKNNLSKDNHGFSGWNTAADGSGISYNEGDSFYMGTADVELFAQWTEDPSYTVTYDGNTNDFGSAPVDSESPYYTGEEVTVLGENDLVKDNHEFSSWNTADDGSGSSYSEGGSFTMASENIILFAQWTEEPSYNIIYDGNGHDEGNPPVDLNNPYYVDEAVIVLGQNTLAKEHYAFNGWNTESEGGGDSYSADDVLGMVESGIILYAQWQPVSYTVTYHEGPHGSLDESGVNEGLHFGDSTPEAPGVTPDYGYLFTSWNPEPTQTVEGNADYYAQYTVADDTLTLEKVPSFNGEEPLDIGDEVSYTFTITNEGNVLIKDIQLSDPGIVFVTTPEPFDLAPGNSITFTAAGTHNITENDALAGFFTNEARAEGTTDEFNEPTIATGSATVVVRRAAPSLILEKDAWADHTPAMTGDDVAYEFTVTNNGNVTLYDVYVDDTYIGFTSTRVILAPGDHHTWTLPDFYKIKEEDLFLGDIYNEATAYGWASMATKPVTYTDDATVIVEDPEPEISIDKSVNDNNVYAGQKVTFTMVVENTGNVTLYDVALTDELLQVSENHSSLAPGESFTFTEQYTTETSDVPGFENLAVAVGHVYQDGEVRVTDSDSVTVTVRKTPPPVTPENWKPDIEVTITPDSYSVYIGEDVVFTMIVSNKGNTILNNVKIINEALDFDEHIPTLFLLGSETYTITRRMTAAGSFEFTVTAQGTSPQGKTVDDTASTAVTVQETVTPPVEPQPENPPENPETGAIPFDIYSVSGLIALGAGIFALIKREKDAEEDEDYDM